MDKKREKELAVIKFKEWILAQKIDLNRSTLNKEIVMGFNLACDFLAITLEEKLKKKKDILDE